MYLSILDPSKRNETRRESAKRSRKHYCKRDGRGEEEKKEMEQNSGDAVKCEASESLFLTFTEFIVSKSDEKINF